MAFPPRSRVQQYRRRRRSRKSPRSSIMAAKTYRAVQVTKPGQLELVERELVPPPKGSVRIRVESCGVCHSDSLTYEGQFPGLTYPRVPGHEIAGVIDAVGTD